MRSLRPARIAWLALFALPACQPAADEEGPGNEAENTASQLPRLPVAEPPIDRKGLLLAVAQAASAAVLGGADRDAQRQLDGKRIEIRIRFGCPATGQGRNGDRFSVRFDEEDRTLRIRAAPDLMMDDPRIAPITGETVEAVEGFWVRRPWLLSAECPVLARTSPAPAEAASMNLTLAEQAKAAAADAAQEDEPEAGAPPSPAPRIGIAQFFTEADARTGRRDSRAYETTKVLGEGEQPSAQGYNLVLSGRLRPLPGGHVITCRMTSFDLPPDCVVSAQFDRVWIERPDTKAVVAEWSS